MNELFTPPFMPSKQGKPNPRSESLVDETATAATPLPTEKTLTSESRIGFGLYPLDETGNLPAPIKPAPNATDSDYDWGAENEDVVLRHQLAIAIYRNTVDGLVIRQERDWNEDDDTYIVISPENIDAFLDKLADVAGIQSFGRPQPAACKVR